MQASELVAVKQASKLIKSFCHSILSTKMLGLASLIKQVSLIRLVEYR